MSINEKDLAAMKKMNSRRFYKWGSCNKIDLVPTGLKSLDNIIWWWIPRGRIVHIFWASWSGKTSLAMHIAKKFENTWDKVLFIDAENTFPEYIRKILDIRNMDVYEPSSWEDAVDTIVDALDQEYKLIILDSVAVCTPMSQLEQSSENNAIWLLPKLMAKMVKLVTDKLAQRWSTLLLLNHERVTIWWYKWQVYAPAQWTILFAASLNIRINAMWKSEYIFDSDTGKLALKPSKVRVLKSKVKALHDEELILYLDLKGRFNEIVDMLIYWLKLWIIKKNWAFIKYWDETLWQWILKTIKILIWNTELNNRINKHIDDRIALIDKQDDVVFSDDVDAYNDLVDEYNEKYWENIELSKKIWMDKEIEEKTINEYADKNKWFESLDEIVKVTKKSKRTIQRWNNQWIIDKRDGKFYLLNI